MMAPVQRHSRVGSEKKPQGHPFRYQLQHTELKWVEWLHPSSLGFPKAKAAINCTVNLYALVS
jgi:hypothetical protein